jgi:hypothetical protein
MFAVKGIADDTYSFTDAGSVVHVPTPEQPLVLLKWGLYLFAPSTQGLAEIARLAREAAGKEGSPKRCPFAHAAPSPADGVAIAQGETILKDLEALDPQTALDRWRGLLESKDPATAAKQGLVNAALRARPGLQPTAYGILISRIKDNSAVLADCADYSVCEYGERMTRSFGVLYLGQDPEDGHDAAAGVPNAFISKITRESAYSSALQIGRAVLAGVPAIVSPLVPPNRRILVDLQQWVDLVLCELVANWFGFPDENAMQKGGSALASTGVACCPDDFRMVSNYVFGPQPTDVMSTFAQRRGRLVAKAARAFTRAATAAMAPIGADKSSESDVLIEHLLRKDYMGRNEDAIARAWIGGVNGFTVPTGEGFLLIMNAWLQSQAFWRLQQAYHPAVSSGSLEFLRAGPPSGFLFREVIQTMQQSPVPFLLHRRVKKAHDVSPGVRATPDTPVVLNLTSAGAEALENGDLDPSVLFGGAYRADKGPRDPVHACPGQEMAWGVIMGLAAALFERKNVVSEGVLSVSIDKPLPASSP